VATSEAAPLLFNLCTNTRENRGQAIGRRAVLKIVAAFEESVKKHALIPMGTPDPYRPPPTSGV
jgi:hypothetical protein